MVQLVGLHGEGHVHAGQGDGTKGGGRAGLWADGVVWFDGASVHGMH